MANRHAEKDAQHHYREMQISYNEVPPQQSGRLPPVLSLQTTMLDRGVDPYTIVGM